MLIKRVRGRTKLSPHRHSHVPDGDHRLDFSKITLFAPLHSCPVVYIYSDYMVYIFLTLCVLMDFLREQERREGSEIENLLSRSVCLAGIYSIHCPVLNSKYWYGLPQPFPQLNLISRLIFVAVPFVISRSSGPIKQMYLHYIFAPKLHILLYH